MSKSRTGTWMVTAFLIGLALASAALMARGTGHAGTVLGLRLTARWSYCLFWPAYAGGALAALFGPVFQPIARRGRNLGLAFAAAHLAHVGLVAWLYYISPRPPLRAFPAIFFGVALVFTYVLALFSVPGLAAKLPPALWRLLRTVGMEFIALAFLSDFLQDPFGHGITNLLAYLPFVGLACGAALLRLAAYARGLHRRTPLAAPTGPVAPQARPTEPTSFGSASPR